MGVLPASRATKPLPSTEYFDESHDFWSIYLARAVGAGLEYE
jgi:hypothetical protein